MKLFYRSYAYLGLASIFGSMFIGFRYDPTAPAYNYLINIVLYAAFAAPHLIMTRNWFKQRFWGQRAGMPVERQAYITVTVITWFLVYAFHRPVPGPGYALPDWLLLVGASGFILCIIAFFEGATFGMIDGLLGVPGSMMSHSHGSETPLLTSGGYASVRHPMYRAALLAGLFSIVMHPNTAGVLWALMITATFVGFIPLEERQLIEARGDAYREYQRQTPYRLVRGVW